MPLAENACLLPPKPILHDFKGQHSQLFRQREREAKPQKFPAGLEEPITRAKKLERLTIAYPLRVAGWVNT